MKNKPTSEQLVDMLEDRLDIIICADVVHGLDLEYKALQEENKKLKMLLSKTNYEVDKNWKHIKINAVKKGSKVK